MNHLQHIRPLLQVKDLTFRYRPVETEEPRNPLELTSSKPTLDAVTFEIKPGELVAIQGASGSGKSTLLSLLAGFLKIQEGDLLIKGKSLIQMDDEALSLFRNQEVGYVFQQFHLLPKLTVIENILLTALYSPDNTMEAQRKRALFLSRFLGLDHRLNHFPHQLSGGQQQRVAIARALLHEPDLILADEPTGNLDSHSAQNIMELLLKLHRMGKTVLIITHSDEIAHQCDRIIHIKDGAILSDVLRKKDSPILRASFEPHPSVHPPFTHEPSETTPPAPKKLFKNKTQNLFNSNYFLFTLFQQAWQDLTSNKVRTLLTMIGIIVGVASILAMVTLGNFIKEKVLESYAEMGINTVLFIGNPNWNLKATDTGKTLFRSFDWDKDILPLFSVFKELQKMTPLIQGGRSTLSFAGKSIESEGRPIGVNEQVFSITGRKIKEGRNFSPYHVEQKNSVCIIGSEVVDKLFFGVSALEQILNVQGNQSSFGCKVIGVLAPFSSNKGWNNPNLEVYLPFTFYQSVAENAWDAQINRVLIQLQPGADVSSIGNSIKGYFVSRYERTGNFRVHNDSVLVAQLQKFLSLFTIAIAAIALICLLVGGIGITNMMLASVAERYREIGLRKALGATNRRIRLQIVTESTVLCGLAGLFGLLIGFFFYQSVIWLTSRFVDSISFQWRFDSSAYFLSFFSIAAVGFLSGLAPAIRAERLQILEALRSD